ncbi:MAG: pentapeptide repeat-containing protein, partial [Pseudomonadota bacterium]
MSELQIDFAIPLPQPFVFLAVLGLCILACATAIHHFGRLKGVIIWLWSLHDHTGVKIFMGIGAILAPFWLALLVFTLSGTFGLWTNLPENIPPNAPDGAGLAYRIHYLALVGLTGSLVALVGAPLALLRVHTVERQTKAQEEGLVTERINKAVENLGAVRSVWVAGDDGDGCDRTEPNMEVRVGAIYALERIAQDSPRDHIQIMEILCAYVRQNAPASSAPDLPDAPQWFEGKNEDGETFDQKISTWQGEHAAKLADYSAPIDIQTAVTVIGRRSPEEIRKQEWGAWQPYSEMVGWYPAHPTDATEKELKSYHEAIESWEKKVSQWQRLAPIFRLDLRATNLTALDASARGKSADWSHALFTGAKVQRANFGNAQLQEADFENAQVQRAYFGNAQVQRANFGNAQAQGANFGNAQLQGAYFGNAQVQ